MAIEISKPGSTLFEEIRKVDQTVDYSANESRHTSDFQENNLLSCKLLYAFNL